MLGKILLVTVGKSWTCPTGKTCTACKKRKTLRVKPNVSVERYKALPVPVKNTTYKALPVPVKNTTYKALPVPVKITTYKDKTRSIVFQPPRKKNVLFNNDLTGLSYPKRRISSRRVTTTKSASKETKNCRRYRRRKALGELKDITKQEPKKLLGLKLEKAGRGREAEFLQELVRREREIHPAKQQISLNRNWTWTDVLFNKVHKVLLKQVVHRQKIIKRPKLVKPRSQKRPFNERFSIFCYKLCCQFYCCLTFLMLIGFAILYFL